MSNTTDDTEILNDMIKYVAWVQRGYYLNRETEKVEIFRPLYLSIIKRFNDKPDYYTLEKKNELTLKANNAVTLRKQQRDVGFTIETLTKTLLEKLKYEFNIKNTRNQIKKIMFEQRLESLNDQVNNMKNKVDSTIFNQAELQAQENMAILLLRMLKFQTKIGAINVIQNRINEIYAGNTTYFNNDKQSSIKTKSEDKDFVIPEYYSNNNTDYNMMEIGIM